MDANIEKINAYRATEFRSEFKPLEGWMHYLLGTAAFQVEDYETAFQHFSILMQGYEKTFLTSAAAEYMEKIKPLLPDLETK